MRQTDIDRAVARATGETVDTIRRLGFTLMPPTRLTPPNHHQPRAYHSRKNNPRLTVMRSV
jgi:hypothetical protein